MRRIILSVLILICAITTSQGAVLVQASPENYKNIDHILRMYTGPSPKFLNNEEKHSDGNILADVLKHPEVLFVRKYLDQQKIKAKVVYVPSTIWNLFVVSKYLKNLDIHDKWKELSDKHVGKDEYQKCYFELSDELIKILESTNEEKNTTYFQKLATEFLKEIKKTTLKEIGDKDVNRNAHKIRDKLIKELEKIESNSVSILHKIIEEEVKANSQNQILLVRGTEGVAEKCAAWEYFQQLKHEYELACVEGKGNCNNPPRVADLKNSLPFYVYSDQEKPGKILDFPYKVGSLGGYFAIQDLLNDLSPEPLKVLSSKGLSFADSFLSGFLLDSGAGKPACTFIFYTPSTIVYTLFLEKKWLFSKGRELFSFKEGSLETDGIFGSGEYFHPRLRELVAYFHPTNHMYISAHNLTLDEKPHFKKEIENDELKKKISQFFLAATNILSKAHIISSPMSSDSNDLLRAQEEISKVLSQKLGVH